MASSARCQCPQPHAVLLLLIERLMYPQCLVYLFVARQLPGIRHSDLPRSLAFGARVIFNALLSHEPCG
jgi:hypothetical protein